MKKIIDWLDERIEIRAIAKSFTDRPIPGGASWWYVLGASLLAVFILQVVTGIFLTFYYVPTPDHAYDSVKYIQNEAIFGNIVRGLHHWCASFMVVLVVMHMLRVFAFGSYKKPREIIWITGLGLLLMVILFAFTGYLLPWDQKAYWATVVGTNVAATVPVIGSLLVRLTRGGEELSALTLSRFFAVHTYILPWMLAIFAVIHVFLVEKIGHAGSYITEKKEADPFFPHQVYKDMIFLVVIVGVLFLLAIYAPSALESRADPSDSSYNPRPEWYFLFMFQLLKVFEGPLEVVGTVVLPGIAGALLLLLPFIDKSPLRDPKKRPALMAAAGLALTGIIALTIAGARTPDINTSSALTDPKHAAARAVFEKASCVACHSLGGHGGKVGPDLTLVGKAHDKAWFMKFLNDPQAVKPGAAMPKPAITELERNQLSDFFSELR